MTCDDCGHSFERHGDRAVAACDGDWNGLSLNRVVPYRRDGSRPVSACGCTGWIFRGPLER